MVTDTVSKAGEAVLVRHRRAIARRFALAGLLALGVLALFVLDLAIGPSKLTPQAVLSGLLNPAALSPIERVIIWDVRLSASLMAVLVGAALSVSGAEMQTVLDNPLASPFTVGVSSAAALGAALAIVLGFSVPGLAGDWIVSANAFLFAVGAVFLLQGLTRLRGGGSETLILFGIALVFSFNALIALLQFYASAQSLQQLVFWMMGSLQRTDWSRVGLLALVLAVVLPFAMRASAQMTALRLGDERALSYGVDVRRLRALALVRVSVLTATAVAFVGTIGFVGLVGPHIARLLIGEEHRFLLPVSALAGALVMLGASILAKVLVPGVAMPVGIVTAIVGVPIFIALVFSRRPQP